MAKIDKLKQYCKSHLDPGETILYTVLGSYVAKRLGQDSLRSGIFAATSKRLVFYANKLFGYDMEIFPYTNISSIEVSKGLMGHQIKFFASGNKVSMKYINSGNINEFINHLKIIIEKKTLSTADKPIDVSARLKQLKDLLAQGLITQVEFEAKKAAIIADV